VFSVFSTAPSSAHQCASYISGVFAAISATCRQRSRAARAPGQLPAAGRSPS
jgi:hypothetical protein